MTIRDVQKYCEDYASRSINNSVWQLYERATQLEYERQLMEVGRCIVPLSIWQDHIEKYGEKKENKQMKLTGFTKAAKINTGGYKPYYYALYDETIKEGDKVLVTGAASDRIHTVEDVVSAETALLEVEKPLCEEVICKVDTSAYDARVKQREQKAKLRKLMEATVAQMDEVDKFKVYAEHSPEMAKLLAQYNEINV